MGIESSEKIKDNEEFSFVPRSYILPEEKEKFMKNSLREESETWIMKNVKNVENQQKFFENLANDNEENFQTPSFIIEERQKNPFTIGTKQPVLNILCLVKSFLPLTVYLYRDAFVNLSSDNHHSQSISFNNLQIQIPNQSNSSENDHNDSVWSLRKFKTYLISKFDPKKVDNCFLNIQQIIIKTLESVQKQIPKSRNSFALYNFQISLDSSLKPFLSNIHHNFPENLCNNEEVLLTKSNLLDDLLTIIDMEKILTGLEDQIGGFDLITYPSFQINKPKTRPSKLGFINTRDTQLNKLAKDAATRLLDAYIQKRNRPEPTRLNFASTENNMFSANSSGPITIISPLSPQGLLSPQGFLSPQGSDGRIIDLSPTKPESNISTHVFNHFPATSPRYGMGRKF